MWMKGLRACFVHTTSPPRPTFEAENWFAQFRYLKPIITFHTKRAWPDGIITLFVCTHLNWVRNGSAITQFCLYLTQVRKATMWYSMNIYKTEQAYHVEMTIWLYWLCNVQRRWRKDPEIFVSDCRGWVGGLRWSISYCILVIWWIFLCQTWGFDE